VAAVKNILFIMCDQLRADYLSCYGQARLETPNIDRIAAMGTRFTRTYCQAPICGASRMSFYTGRYVLSHGATWNFVPLPVNERTMGEYLRPLGLRVAVVGKTHHEADLDGMRRIGLSPEEGAGHLIAQGGFEPYWRDDGIHPDQSTALDLPYNEYLRERGFTGSNPWHEWANSAQGADGEIASGWYARNARLPARLPERFSETAYATDRAIEFMREQGDKPWCLHLSYIKPHWPYIAPAPFHAVFTPGDAARPIRAEHERDEVNPIFKGFQGHPESVSMSQDAFRLNVVPTYMGLVKQIDMQIGRLLDDLAHSGRLGETLIAFTSDHGDFLGDHWLGEKEFMYEASVRIPLIVADPAQGARRGAVSDALVEAIDLLPTFIEALGADPPAHVLEGRSLLSHLRGFAEPCRDAVFSELDYAIYPTARKLCMAPRDARMVMVRSKRWKYVHFGKGLPPQLFDLAEDPGELCDLGRDAGHAHVREEHVGLLFDWMQSRRNRVAIDDKSVASQRNPAEAGGVIIGQW
jgi:arylsulfatase A-like enzyme